MKSMFYATPSASLTQLIVLQQFVVQQLHFFKWEDETIRQAAKSLQFQLYAAGRQRGQ